MPYAGRGRPYPRHTKLGQIMWERGLTVNKVAAATTINHRALTEYLAGRKRPTTNHLAFLTRALEVTPQHILEDKYPHLAPPPPPPRNVPHPSREYARA